MAEYPAGAVRPGTYVPTVGDVDVTGKPTFAFHLVKGYPEHDPYSYDRTIGQGNAAVDTAAVQAALTACGTRGRLKLNPLSLNLNTGLVIPPGVSWEQDSQCTLTAQHSGVALTFDGGGSSQHTGQDGKRIHVRIRRAGSVGPWASTPESSIGVRFRNMYCSRLSCDEIFGFDTGVEFLGDDTEGSGANLGNIFDIGYIVNNRRGLVLSTVGSGFVNSNTFRGGSIHMDSNAVYQNEPGSRFILIGASCNNHVFDNIDVEANGTAIVEKSIECNGGENLFLNLRYELLVAGQVHFTSTSARNRVIGGFGNFGPERAPFLDEGDTNQIDGARSIRRFADGTGAAYIGQAVTSSSNRVWQGRTTSGAETSSINGNGTIGARYFAQSFDRVAMNPTSALPPGAVGGIEFGTGTSAVPDVGFGRVGTAVKGLQANCPLLKRTVVTTHPSSGTAQSINPGDGEIFVYNLQANLTSLLIAANPGVGTVITLVFAQDATGSRTYIYPSNVPFRFAGNVAPTASTAANVSDAVTFRWTGTVWAELSRSIGVPSA